MKKIVLGFVTLLPGIYAIAFFSVGLLVLIFDWHPTVAFMQTFMALHMACILLIVGLLVFYIRDIYHNAALTPDQRMFWVIVLLFGNIISMPIYWYSHILRSHDKR